jgi:HEAT repeat protein
MARPDPTREGLARLADIRGDPRTPEAREVLRAALAGKSNAVAARAARICGEANLHEFVGDLEAAFARYLVDPLRTDPSCLAKGAIVEALGRLGAGDDTLIAATRHIQREPTNAEPIDTAADMRAAAVVALAERNHPRALEVASELLADKEPRARLGAITSFRTLPSEGAAALLRFKALRYLTPPDYESQRETGDEIAEALASLLVCSADSLPLVSGLLMEGEPETASLAAIAIGESGVGRALDVLKQAFAVRLDVEVRQAILAAVGMLRVEGASDFLLEIMAKPDQGIALVALDSLSPFFRDPVVRARAAEAVRDSGSRRLLDAFRRLE